MPQHIWFASQLRRVRRRIVRVGICSLIPNVCTGRVLVSPYRHRYRLLLFDWWRMKWSRNRVSTTATPMALMSTIPSALSLSRLILAWAKSNWYPLRELPTKQLYLKLTERLCVCVCVPRAFIQNKYFFVISTWAQAKIYWLFHLALGSLRQRTINIVECCRHIMFETKSFHATQDMLFFSSSPYIVFDGRLRFFSMIYWFAKRDLAWRLLTDLLLPLIPSSHTSSRIRRRCSNSKHAME